MKNILFPVLAIALLASCKKEEPVENTPNPVNDKMTVRINPMFGADEMKIDSIYTTTNGDRIKITLFKMLMQDIEFSGETIDAALYNSLDGNDLLSIDGKPTNTSFSSNIGVESDLNHNDPTQFPSDSPLNILNANDMHWSWNPGYIFFKIEARMDTINDGVDDFDHFVNYHIGKDANFRTLNLSDVNWESSGTNHQLNLVFDFEKFISNGTNVIDLRQDNITHSGAGQESLSTLVADNFRDAFSN